MQWYHTALLVTIAFGILSLSDDLRQIDKTLQQINFSSRDKLSRTEIRM
jgi:hypothetical protein